MASSPVPLCSTKATISSFPPMEEKTEAWPIPLALGGPTQESEYPALILIHRWGALLLNPKEGPGHESRKYCLIRCAVGCNLRARAGKGRGQPGYTAKLRTSQGWKGGPACGGACCQTRRPTLQKETTVTSCCGDHHIHEMACGCQTTCIHIYTKTKQMQLRNRPSHFRRKSCGAYCGFLELWVTFICSVTSETDTEQSPTVQAFLERALGRQECSVQIKESFFFFLR